MSRERPIRKLSHRTDGAPSGEPQNNADAIKAKLQKAHAYDASHETLLNTIAALPSSTVQSDIYNLLDHLVHARVTSFDALAVATSYQLAKSPNGTVPDISLFQPYRPYVDQLQALEKTPGGRTVLDTKQHFNNLYLQHKEVSYLPIIAIYDAIHTLDQMGQAPSTPEKTQARWKELRHIRKYLFGLAEGIPDLHTKTIIMQELRTAYTSAVAHTPQDGAPVLTFQHEYTQPLVTGRTMLITGYGLSSPNRLSSRPQLLESNFILFNKDLSDTLNQIEYNERWQRAIVSMDLGTDFLSQFAIASFKKLQVDVYLPYEYASLRRVIKKRSAGKPWAELFNQFENFTHDGRLPNLHYHNPVFVADLKTPVTRDTLDKRGLRKKAYQDVNHEMIEELQTAYPDNRGIFAVWDTTDSQSVTAQAIAEARQHITNDNNFYITTTGLEYPFNED